MDLVTPAPEKEQVRIGLKFTLSSKCVVPFVAPLLLRSELLFIVEIDALLLFLLWQFEVNGDRPLRFVWFL